MLNQAQGDREILAKQLNISQQQMTYVTHSDAGEGLNRNFEIEKLLMHRG